MTKQVITLSDRAANRVKEIMSKEYLWAHTTCNQEKNSGPFTNEQLEPIDIMDHDQLKVRAGFNEISLLLKQLAFGEKNGAGSGEWWREPDELYYSWRPMKKQKEKKAKKKKRVFLYRKLLAREPFILITMICPGFLEN